MIIIHVQVQVQQDKFEEFLSSNTHFLMEARSFKGCVKFDLYRDSWDAQTFAYYELWETEENFRAYQTSESFADWRVKVGPMLAAPPVSSYFKGSQFE